MAYFRYSRTLLSALRSNSNFLCRVNMNSESNKPLVLTEQLGNVFLIGINRPEKRNCVNVATAHKLLEAFQYFEKSDDLLVAILHGKGGNFCAGYDLAELSSLPNSDQADFKLPDAGDFIESGQGPMGPSRMLTTKPIIGAVTGYAVAGGLELALVCDMRVAEENAVFGVFCRRFGVPLLDGGTVRLPQLIGLSRAMDMILTGRPVAAQEALQMGLANRVVPTGTALGEAVKLAQTMCNFPQECMRRDKRSAYYSTFDAKSYEDAFIFENNNAAHVLTQESVTGAQRFVNGVGRSGDFSKFNKHKL